MARLNDLLIENARTGFHNFSGAESQYNKSGDRNFVVFLEDEEAERLSAQGWNIKFPVQDPEKEYKRQPFLPVSLRFDKFPPSVWMKTGDKMTRLTENTIGSLDRAVIEYIDLNINPSYWEIQKKGGVDSGIKAYVKKMIVVIQMDVFDQKYGHLMYDQPEDNNATDFPVDIGLDDAPF